MHHPFIFRLLVCLLILNLDACGDVATLPEQAGIGPHPTLPPPNPTLLPTVNIAPAKGWPTGVTPRPAAGLAVSAFAATRAGSMFFPTARYWLPKPMPHPSPKITKTLRAGL